MARISKWKFVDACLDGIEKSQKQYEEWSGGYWLMTAPEYLMTVNIAKEIWEIPGDKFIDLEYSVANALKETGTKSRGPLPSSMRPNGKSDILVWWGSKGTPRGIIELKNHADDYSNHIKDIQRICTMLKKGKSNGLEFGIFSFFIYAHYQNNDEEVCRLKLEKRILNFTDTLSEYINDSFQHDVRFKVGDVDDGWVWGSVAILIW